MQMRKRLLEKRHLFRYPRRQREEEEPAWQAQPGLAYKAYVLEDRSTCGKRYE